MYLPDRDGGRAVSEAAAPRTPRRGRGAVWWALPVAGLALFGTWRAIGTGSDAPPPPPPSRSR